MLIKIKKLINWIRWGKITYEIKSFAGDHVVAEVEYYDRNGKVIGYWAYGHFNPEYPYQGDPLAKEKNGYKSYKDEEFPF